MDGRIVELSDRHRVVKSSPAEWTSPISPSLVDSVPLSFTSENDSIETVDSKNQSDASSSSLMKSQLPFVRT